MDDIDEKWPLLKEWERAEVDALRKAVAADAGHAWFPVDYCLHNRKAEATRLDRRGSVVGAGSKWTGVVHRDQAMVGWSSVKREHDTPGEAIEFINAWWLALAAKLSGQQAQEEKPNV